MEENIKKEEVKEEIKIIVHGGEWINKELKAKCPECDSKELRIAKDVSKGMKHLHAPLKCLKCGCIFTHIPKEEK